MSDSHPEMLKTFIVVPKSGDAVRVKAEHVMMSLVNHSVRLSNGPETVALFDTNSIIGVIEEASFMEAPARQR